MGSSIVGWEAGIILFCSAFMLSSSFVLLLLRSKCRERFIDTPDERKVHLSPIPRLGGVGFVAAFAVLACASLLVPHASDSFRDSHLLQGLAIAAGIIFAVGILDDGKRVRVRVRHKLVTELVAALIVVFIFDIRFGSVSLWPGVQLPQILVLGLSVVWIIGVTNALNIIDGLDSLAGGLALVSFLTIGLLAAKAHAGDLVLLCLMLAGVTIGFLVFNLPPAKVFMGDTGSLFLGFCLAVLSMEATRRTGTQPSILVAVLLVGVPVLDVFVAMVRRFFKGRDNHLGLLRCVHKMFIADNNHIHHRLTYRGYSHLQTSLVLAAIAISMGFAALSFSHVSYPVRVAVLAYLGFCLAFSLNRFGFGDRFKNKVIRRLHSSNKSETPHKTLIGVFNADPLFQRNIVNHPHPAYHFVFFKGEGVTHFIGHMKALLVIAAGAQHQTTYTAFARELAMLSSGPVLILSEDNGKSPEMIRSQELSNLFLANATMPAADLIACVEAALFELRRQSHPPHPACASSLAIAEAR